MIAPAKPVYMTEKGIRKTQTELETLLKIKRPEVLGYLQDAKDGGDSADNTEYLYLAQELETIDQRISDLRYRLDHAQLIQRVEQKDAITIGSTVVIQEDGAVPETYTIVGSAEADPDEGSISDESPLGRALLNHRIGEKVVVDSPGGLLLFRIVDIS
ncbi:MAG TPA: GreA/GreB family elongation factor [Anaerolineae bacterium]|nr:GreA/GreB family elongation factor [Anaerolineae bacterium]